MKYRLIAVALLLCMLSGCDGSGAGSTAQTTTDGIATEPSTAPATTAAPSTAVPGTTATQTVDDAAQLLRQADRLVRGMSLEQRVRQLFIVTLAGEDGYYAGSCDAALQLIQQGQPGGFVLFPDNITTERATADFMRWIQAVAVTPMFIAIDEEGGRVSRLGSAERLGYDKTPSAAELAEMCVVPPDDSGDSSSDETTAPEQSQLNTDPVFEAAAGIGNMLGRLCVNVDFAPVCDVLTESKNSAIGDRSFGGQPDLVGELAATFMLGLRSEGIMAAAKHFPGQGAAKTDTHNALTVISRDRATMREVDYPPFERAIAEGVEFVMVGHATYPDIDPSGLPASMSHDIVTGLLRGSMGFEGVVVTDAMDMGALTSYYRPGEAAVRALEAGVDMLLMPPDFEASVQSVLDAVAEGRISEARIAESARRVLLCKLRGGVIDS